MQRGAGEPLLYAGVSRASPQGHRPLGRTVNRLTHPPLQFKGSALRKQSLYLKFDPLLKDSPQRPLPVALQTSRYASL